MNRPTVRGPAVGVGSGSAEGSGSPEDPASGGGSA